MTKHWVCIDGELMSVSEGSIVVWDATTATTATAMIDLTTQSTCFWLHGVGFVVPDDVLIAHPDSLLSILALRWPSPQKLEFSKPLGQMVRHVQMREREAPFDTPILMPAIIGYMANGKMCQKVPGLDEALDYVLGRAPSRLHLDEVVCLPSVVTGTAERTMAGNIRRKNKAAALYVAPMYVSVEDYDRLGVVCSHPLFVKLVRHIKHKTPLRRCDAGSLPIVDNDYEEEKFAPSVWVARYERAQARHVKADGLVRHAGRIVLGVSKEGAVIGLSAELKAHIRQKRVKAKVHAFITALMRALARRQLGECTVAPRLVQALDLSAVLRPMDAMAMLEEWYLREHDGDLHDFRNFVAERVCTGECALVRVPRGMELRVAARNIEDGVGAEWKKKALATWDMGVEHYVAFRNDGVTSRGGPIGPARIKAWNKQQEKFKWTRL